MDVQKVSPHTFTAPLLDSIVIAAPGTMTSSSSEANASPVLNRGAGKASRVAVINTSSRATANEMIGVFNFYTRAIPFGFFCAAYSFQYLPTVIESYPCEGDRYYMNTERIGPLLRQQQHDCLYSHAVWKFLSRVMIMSAIMPNIPTVKNSCKQHSWREVIAVFSRYAISTVVTVLAAGDIAKNFKKGSQDDIWQAGNAWFLENERPVNTDWIKKALIAMAAFEAVLVIGELGKRYCCKNKEELTKVAIRIIRSMEDNRL